jgi:protein-L-isoaspartate(D-aspartate) O-methyltransferase
MGLPLRSNGGFAAERERLVEELAKRREDLDPGVLAAVGRVPRHRFVPEHLQLVAYEDRALPIGSGQTVSAPHMVAIMCTVLGVRRGEKVLEVGTGSGYHAAVLAELVGPEGRVVSIEVVPGLAHEAQARLEEAGYAGRVTVMVGDGAEGDPDGAPFDRITMAAATPSIPPALLDQLGVGGVLVAPVGRREAVLTRVERTEKGLRKSEHGVCVFVPLTGSHGVR